jgi:hypothetical protein
VKHRNRQPSKFYTMFIPHENRPRGLDRYMRHLKKFNRAMKRLGKAAGYLSKSSPKPIEYL